jgi:O-6-methylguanine DNA methyltransferase
MKAEFRGLEFFVTLNAAGAIEGLHMRPGKAFNKSKWEKDLSQSKSKMRKEFAAFVKKFIGKKPLCLIGTEFQKHIWNELRKTKPGELLSYSDLAKRVGRPRAVRAVASAMAKNRICLLIPCHRVLPKDMSWGKYGRYPELKPLLCQLY